MKDLSGFTPRPLPGGIPLEGLHVVLEPFSVRTHGLTLAQAISSPSNRDIWTFMPFEPSDELPVFAVTFADISRRNDWASYVILDRDSGETLGTASYMRQRPEHGSCEVGCVAFSPRLKRSTQATEAMFLMASHVFDHLGYRRYEWKCHNENAASKRAAVRLGFRFEGVFRNDMVMKGKNRDTAWYAMTDEDWPQIRADFELWLSPSNFDETGQQKVSLSALRARHQMLQQQQ